MAVVLERPSVLPPLPPAWEVEYREWQFAWNLPYYKKYPDSVVVEQSVGEDASNAGAPGWAPAPTETPADASGAVDTLERRLRDNLFLVVRVPPSKAVEAAPGASGLRREWALPAVAVAEGETVRAAAERCLAETLGAGPAADAARAAAVYGAPDKAPKLYMVGNAPAAHVRDPADEAKGTFFLLSQLVKGTPRHAKHAKGAEVAWLTKEELKDALVDQESADVLQKAL